MSNYPPVGVPPQQGEHILEMKSLFVPGFAASCRVSLPYAEFHHA